MKRATPSLLASGFWTVHSRCFDEVAVAGVFVLLMLNGDDRRRKPFAERNEALAKLLFRSRDGIQYVEHAEGHGDKPPPAISVSRALFLKGWTPPIGRVRRKPGSR